MNNFNLLDAMERRRDKAKLQTQNTDVHEVNTSVLSGIEMYNNNHNDLQITIIILLLAFVFFIVNSKKNWIECTVGCMLILTFIFSQIFWANPIQYSFYHKIDAVIAKISIAMFLLYTLLYKDLSYYTLISYLLIMLGVAGSFYFSNYYSSREWCCDNHLFYHKFLHIFGGFGAFYAFI